ncbi:MAG TPA: Fe-S-binding domain-containing protein, partial [Acidimicrobiia bacterium]|nr:Fe-S-binding domain-containing protein [Acidimicrobiia bacterium]
MTDFPILTTLLLLPAVGAVLVMFAPKGRTDVIRVLGYATTIATLGFAIFLLKEFDKADAGVQFVSHHQWMPDLGVSYSVGVDGISLFMVALTALLFPIGLLASANEKNLKSFVVWMLLLEAALIGVFIATDLVLFFVFFEVVLVPMYFLI